MKSAKATELGKPRRRPARPAVILAAGLVLAGAAVVMLRGPLAVWRRQSRARELLAERREAAALEQLRAALRLDPENAETLLLLARTHRRLGSLDTVSSLLARAEAVGGDAGRVERERRLLLAQSGHVREVEPYLADMLITAGVDGPDICEAFVQGYFANLRINEALALLDVWQQSYPEDAQPVFMRAYLFQSMNHPEEAIALYRKGLAVAPHRTEMRRRLAEVLLEAGKADEAESELSACVRQVAEDAPSWYLLARCAYARSDLDLATERLGHAIRLAPDHGDARRLKGQIALARGKLDEALRELEAVVARRPYDTLAREALGRTLRALGREDEARGHFDFVAEAEKNIGRMNRLLRQSLHQPKDAELRYQIGSILFQYGPPDDAARWMQAALQLDPEHAGAHRALAAYFEARGDTGNATFHLQRALLGQGEP